MLDLYFILYTILNIKNKIFTLSIIQKDWIYSAPISLFSDWVVCLQQHGVLLIIIAKMYWNGYFENYIEKKTSIPRW